LLQWSLLPSTERQTLKVVRFDVAESQVCRNKGCGGGVIVSVLAFFSDDPSSNLSNDFSTL